MFGLLLGGAALVLGLVALRGVRRGTAGGRGLAIAGAVLGALAVLVAGGVAVVAVLFATSGTGKQLADCLDRAGNEQAAVAQCEREFADGLGR